MIETPGLYQIPLAEYLADPVGPDPSLSSGIAHTLLEQSPRHAWEAHPRLNPHYAPEESEAFDIGTAAHALLLEGTSAVVIIDADSWRTKESREKREAARLAGKVPLLAHRWVDVQAMEQAARRQLAAHEAPIPFTAGKPESTLVWVEDGAWCRIRPDWLHEDATMIWDYKTSSASAHPAVWSRVLFNNGSDLQAALYRRGVKQLLGVEPDFRFVVQETYPPYALSVLALDPEAVAFATQKLERAIDLWRDCVRTNTWPGYPTRTCYAEVPGYLQAQWAERSYFEEATR